MKISSERSSSTRHALTKAKAVTLLCQIRHRNEQPKQQQQQLEEKEEEEEEEEEEDMDQILPPTIKKSSLGSPFTLTQSKYVSPTKSKGMIKSYRIFEIDSNLSSSANEDSDVEPSPRNSRRNSKEPTSGVVFPKINDMNRSQTKSLLVGVADPIHSSTESRGEQISPPSQSQARGKVRDRRSRLSKRQTATPSTSPQISSSSSSSVAKALRLKRSNYIETDSSFTSLPPDQASKYFGNNSKSIFFDTYREIYHLRDNVLGGNEEIDHYITLAHRDLDQEIDHYSASRHQDTSGSLVSHLDETSTILTIQEDDYEDSLQESPLPSTATVKAERLRYQFPPIDDGNLTTCDDGSVSTMESNTTLASQFSRRSFTPSSPRAKYLAGCIKNNVPPRSLLLLRDNVTSCLMLEHQGIGDKMAKLLSIGLLDIPYITSVNIADNNLTDASLTLIINAIAHRPSITELNISRNKVGSSTARALGNYLKSSNCTLKIISMRAANVDDTECHQFVEALGYNNCLEELDLSENLLGKDENLNAVKPDTITAGESLAVLLQDCRCPIHTLKLAWNMIRMEGAVRLCESLQYQRHLRHLDISFNSLGREGGLALGNSLLDNHVLEELLISSNSIDSMACFAICVGIREGKSVRYLNIDGNPIGEAGARILMRLPTSCGSRVTFTARNCDLSMKQNGSWFNSTGSHPSAHSLVLIPFPPLLLRLSDPVCKDVFLDMSNPYDLAVMYEILDLIARHPSYQFSRVQYGEDRETKNWQDMNFLYLEETNTSVSASEAETLTKLKRTVEMSENFDLCTQYFQASDRDGSGELSENEFFDILDRLELSLSQRQKLSAMTLYDSDHSGAIQLEEFQEFIAEVAKDSRLKIRDIETSARCAEANSPKTRYLPPRRGVFVVSIINGYMMGESGRALTEEQVNNIIAMAKNSSSPTTLLQYAAESDLLRLNEAQEIFQHIVTECGDSAVALAAIIPNMASSTEAKNLMTLSCGGGEGGDGNEDEKLIINKLKQQFGNAYRPMIGLADGYYSLDFHSENDRLCMKKLLELSTTYASIRQGNQLGDVSQDGNWSCFRNEYFTGQEIRLTTAFLSSMPKSGRIEFDFVGSDRLLAIPTTPRQPTPRSSQTRAGVASNQSINCITDRKIIQILIQINLLSSQHIHWGYDELTTLRSVCRKSLSTGGSTPYWTCSMGRILEAQRYKYEKIYSNLSERRSQMDRALKREQKYSTTAAGTMSRGGFGGSKSSTKKAKRLLSKKSVGLTSLGILSDDENDENENCDEDEADHGSPHHSMNPIPEELLTSSPVPSPTGRKSSFTNAHQQTQRKSIRKIGQDLPLGGAAAALSSSSALAAAIPSYGNGPQACALCAKIVSQLEQLLSNKWILVRHLILIMKCFSMGSLKKTDFGTYRVEVAVSLFSRIKDTHNFHLIFSSLTSEEHGMILARIGILNIFDPLRPEGAYSLDLSVWEERQVCKMLIHIAAAEPGSNWLTQIFQFDRNSKPSTGWVLTVNWYTEDGLPRKGLVSLAYTCGHGIHMNGCSPVKLHRQSLLGLVLHRIDFYQYDDTNAQSETILFPSSSASRGTLTGANQMLSSLDADIKWNYDPPCLAHE